MSFDPDLLRRCALLTAEESRAAEQAACADGSVTLDGLMQRAGAALAEVILARYQPCRISILAGPGNNGGDGFVLAEILRGRGWPVRIGALTSHALPTEATRARRAYQGEVEEVTPALFDGAELVVDALFGTGLKRAIEGDTADLIRDLASRRLDIVAVDVPSGIDSDTGAVLGEAVQADLTVTFFRLKRAHALRPGRDYCGEVLLKDIGIKDDVLRDLSPLTVGNEKEVWQSQIPLPGPGWHKYTRGHALVLGGGVMTGAARLATRAAQRMGAGLVTLAVPARAVSLYAAALDSVIVREAETIKEWEDLLADPKRNVLVLGPGLGLDVENKAFVLAALATKKPAVLDADALTLFAEKPTELFEALHPNCVLTPHEGEFLRLFGEAGGGDKLARARFAATQAGCVVVLKGADTVIARPGGDAVVNLIAPPWLATAGAGDVLAGLLGGLLANNVPVFEAGAAAAGLHGLIAEAFGPGLIAEDLIAGVPAQLKDLSIKRGKSIII